MHSLNLHRHLRAGQISFAVLANQTSQHGPRRSSAMLNQLALHGKWPVTIPKQALQTQIEAALRALNVPAAEIKTAWQPELSDRSPEVVSPQGDTANLDAPNHDEKFTLPEPQMLTEETFKHFNLTRNPFGEIRNVADIYRGPDYVYAHRRLREAVENAGFFGVWGESGAGKSTLQSELLESIRRGEGNMIFSHIQCVEKKSLTANHICDALIADLSIETPRITPEAKSRQVRRILAESVKATNGAPHVLWIDEAHRLTNAALHALKGFWEMKDGIKRMLGIVLIGQLDLGEKLLNMRMNPTVREVIQRVELVKLQPLDKSVKDYVVHRFNRAGVKASDVFEDDAYLAMQVRLTRYSTDASKCESNVHPLAVNNLICRAMNRAPELGLRKVSADLIKTVAGS